MVDIFPPVLDTPVGRVRKLRRRTPEEVRVRDSSGRKQCVRCEGWHPETDYYPNKQNKADGLRAFCRFCAAKEDSVKRHHLGMEGYIQLVEQQNNKCAICLTSDPTPDMLWTIDHDHNCCPGTYSCGNCIRGLLCRTCNMALGLLKENKDTLSRAANYLEEYHD